MKGLRHYYLSSYFINTIKVRIDLIYEGIATWLIYVVRLIITCVRIDLIYEGIATCLFGIVTQCLATVRIDLIYEGIATPRLTYPLHNRLYQVRIDLIYEGIATKYNKLYNIPDYHFLSELT